ncbi:hypothetical protein EGT36_03285 [Agrobacterium sp. FDAARGOS_525]|uniref:hypothetical protein n=1 Tax=Agrobacterium sp. FDAARGOS_525 TaxID=2420311 RepID=UPI000F67D77E|nr:hypothetical protein [Agrobacterium sp. FDAARGOS_525]RSC36416.1 hypothetical protein EGT36_03285 [Agrobacterium sp. FDAARGOS_525]
MTSPDHQQLTALCMAQLEDLGRSSGRSLFQRLLMSELPEDSLEEQVDAAVQDLEDHLIAGGTCDNDLQIACNKFRLALLQEGRRLIALIPDQVYEGGLQ